MSGPRQVREIDRLGKEAVDLIIETVCAYPLSEGIDLILKAAELIKILEWLEENTAVDR